MRMRVFMGGIAVAMLLASCSVSASQTGTLCVEGLKLKTGERVIAYDLDLKGATFLSLPSIPLGWTIQVSNDSNGLTKAKAGIIDFSAAIYPENLGCLATFKKADYFDKISYQLKIWVQVGDEKEREIQVDKKYLKLR